MISPIKIMGVFIISAFLGSICGVMGPQDGALFLGLVSVGLAVFNNIKIHYKNKHLIIGEGRVHIKIKEGDSGDVAELDWGKQMAEIRKAWEAGDYEFARTWLQKLAYTITAEKAPDSVHAKFKELMVAFTKDDPLYATVMDVALPVIREQPGIIQSQLAKQYPQFDAEQFRYAMYYGEIIGDVVREKKGRSYALSLPPSPGGLS